MTEAKPPKSYPFGLRRHHFIAIRVLLVVGVVVVGSTLHHHGPLYIVIRGLYFALILGFIVWRLNGRRVHRRSRRAGAGTDTNAS
jgi:Flp pilus assembly protein TadB